MVTLNSSFLEAFYAGFTETKAGRLFEHLAQRILADLHPYWSGVFREVVSWKEHARRYSLPAKEIRCSWECAAFWWRRGSGEGL